MCGITAFFARESRIDYKYLDMLFKGTERRGQDGFGFILIKRSTGDKPVIIKPFKSEKMYSQCSDEVKSLLKDKIDIGDLIIAISRAAPETECSTDIDDLVRTMQPIVNVKEGLVLVHNGAITNQINQELRKWASESDKYEFQSDIDSESIIASYVKHGRNMKDAMEYLSGGVAAIMYDQDKDMIMVVNDHMQIAHSYIRGLGFFLHSDNDVLGDVIYDYCNAPRNGLCLWETFYNHYLDGHAVREIDLQSGFMRKEKYTPRYITPTFDSIYGIRKGITK